MSLGARLRSFRANQQLPTYVVIAAVAVAVITLAVRRGFIDRTTIILFACFIPAVILHEVSHGVVALWCGDDTAKRAGRLTLNPVRHIDPIGSVILPAILILTHAPVFGWAKPVPVSLSRLRRPRDQAVLVGLAGPVTNIVLAAIAGVVFHLLISSSVVAGQVYSPPSLAAQIAGYFGIVNVLLAAFNLIPIPPLDGSALIERLLPASALEGYYRIRTLFMFAVLALVLFDQGLLSNVFVHVENWYLNLFI